MVRIKKEEHPLLYNEALSLYKKSNTDKLCAFPEEVRGDALKLIAAIGRYFVKRIQM